MLDSAKGLRAAPFEQYDRWMSRGQVIDVLISVAIGTYCILAGMGIVRVSKNAEAEEKWRDKYGAFAVIAGVLIILTRTVAALGSR
jgi:hypothetical protein